MGCPSEVEIGDNLVFSVTTQRVDTGAATDADSVPTYRIYEDETGTAILTGSMAKLDDANTTGFYSELIACTSGNGFENGKSYTIYIAATVNSVAGVKELSFKAYDARKSNVTQVSGSAEDLPTATALAAAQADLDLLTGADGAILATAQANYAPAKAGDAMALTSGERTTLAAVIWNSLTSGMTTVGSIGKKLADWTIHSAADVWAVGTRTLTAATNITSTGGTTVPQTGDSYARLGAPAGASVSADVAAVKTDTGNLVTRITSTLFSGITSLAEWLGLLAGKQTGDTTARTELRATGAGSGTFDETADSLEAIRDRGDSAWITGGGGGITQSLNVQFVHPTSIDLAGTATVRLGIILVNALDDLPSTAEITPGTISIERKAIGGTSWSAVVTDAAMSEQSGMVYYDEVFDAGSGYAEGDSIRITFKSVSITADSNTHEVVGAAGVFFQTEIRQTMRGTDSANTTTPLDAAGVRSAVGLASANLDTQLGALPTAAENRAEMDSNSTQLAALVSAIAALNDLSSVDAQAAAAAALTAYDPATGTEVAAVLAAIGALNDLDAAAIRAAVGLTSANLDTQLAALPTGAENATALLTLADAIETGITVKLALQVVLAAIAGASSDDGKEFYKAVPAGSTATGTKRIDATMSGKNRTLVVIDGS